MRPTRLAVPAVVMGLLACSPAFAATFATAPDVPDLPAVTLAGGAQTVIAQMPAWSVTENLAGAGWNVTVAGDSSSGASPVFRAYCPPPGPCGADPAGYVSGPYALAPGSLTLDSSGATFTGGSGAAPLHLCASGCALDSATPVKVASAVVDVVPRGTWTASGYSTTSLTLSLPSTLRVPPNAGELYRVDLVWTLGSGP